MSAQFSTELRLQQQQILAPQLQQSMKLLQVPAIELQALIARQLATNPTLETYDPIRDDETRDLESFDPDVQDRENVREERKQTLTSESSDLLAQADNPDRVYEKEMEHIISEDENWKSYYESEEIYSGKLNQAEAVVYRERRPADDEEYMFRMQSIPASRSLVDDLREQYRSLDLSPEENEVFEYLIGSLDKSGFLPESSDELAKTLEKPLELVQRLLGILKRFEPPGIGAANLQDCLLIQLERKGKKDCLAYRLIEEYYEDLLGNRRERIAKGLGVSVETLNEAIADIGHLDPNPGRDLSPGAAVAICPDVIVSRMEDGRYYVETNDNLLPYIRISPRMRNLVKNKAFNKKELSYMRNEIRNGEGFVNNLQFRKRTVLAVAEAIVDVQKEFLSDGPTSLKPLSMKEVAEKVGVHEATVSRTVNEKYIDTPQGVFEMRYFFSSHVASTDGDDISTNAVKAKLRELIENEDKQHPFSDAKLAEMLKDEGCPVARRTVVKYRKALGILNTRQRKVFV